MRYQAGLEFDQYVAKYYVHKMQSCASRGIAFKLTLTQVKNMLRAKHCGYTKELLTHTRTTQIDSDVTIDRVDCTKPYETGNVIACSYKANRAKNSFESLYRGEANNVMAGIMKVVDKRSKAK